MKTLIRAGIILFVLMIGLFAFLLTPSGLRTSVWAVSKILPGKLIYQHLSGVIIGPINVEHLRYEDGAKIIDIKKLHVDWNLIDLITQKLHISTLKANSILITTKKETSPNGTSVSSLISMSKKIKNIIETHQLPFQLSVHHIDIKKIMVENLKTDTNTTIKNIWLNAQFTKKRWDMIASAQIEKPNPFHFNFSLTGKPSHYAIKTTLNGLQTNWALIGNGDQDGFQFHTTNTLLLGHPVSADTKVNWEKTLLLQSHLNAKTPGGLLTLKIAHDQQWKIHFNLKKGLKNKTDVRLSGEPKKQILSVHVKTPKETVRIKLNSAFQQEQWTGNLEQFSIALKNSFWQLKQPVDMTASNDFFEMTPLCLIDQRAGSACFQANLKNDAWSGNINTHITQFDWLKTFVPAIHVSQGDFHTNLTITGNTEKPKITGTIKLTQSSIAIPALNITLNKIAANVTTKSDHVHFDLTAFSKNQPITAKGWVDLENTDLILQANIITQNALLMNTDEYVIYVTSDLQAKIIGHDIFLTGNLTIPTATLKPADFQNTTTLPENDIVFIGKANQPEKPVWAVHNDITVYLGDAVHVIASGLDVMLGGNLKLQKSPEKDMTATGNVFVRQGTFSIYGKKLTIEKDSYVAYNNGFLNNPTLSIKASKIIPTTNALGGNTFSQYNLIVGIDVSGTVKEPRINFFSSNGNLSQVNIVSYLLFGYGDSSGTPGNTDMLLSALSSVGLSSQGLFGKQNIASQIESGLGLSEMGVESNTTVDTFGNPLNQQSAFVVGKHLTNKISVRYSIGMLQQSVNIFQLRYTFNKNWAVQGDSSSLGNGADVLYTIER